MWAEKKAEKYDRLAKYSLDTDNQQKYSTKAVEWKSRTKKYSKSSDKNADEILENNHKKDIIISRDNLEKFKNSFSELGIKNVLGFETYSGDVKILEDIVEDFKTLKQIFPKIFNEFSGVTYFEQASDEYASFYIVTKIINFNKKFYDHTSTLMLSYENDVILGYHPQKTTYRANVFHEFGHCVESIADINPKNLAKKYSNNKMKGISQES